MQRALASVARPFPSGSRFSCLAKTFGLSPSCRRAGLRSYFHPPTRTLHWTALRSLNSKSSSPLSSLFQSSDLTSPALSPPSSKPSPPPETFKLEPRLALTFTCTVIECGHRSSHEFTKRSYERGIVIVQCPGCKNRHLIADHLGWFKDITEEGQQRTIEDIMKAKGETVRRGHVDSTGNVVEFTPE